MAYDEALADRIRALLEGAPLLTEKKMFGGLGFMLGGNMAVAASGQGGILVRVDPTEGEHLIATTPASDEVKVLGVLNDHATQTVPGGVQVQLGDA